MDSPPAKRRRTSPRLAQRAGSADNGATTAENATATNTTPPDPPPPSKIPRPSFASPTRASLARHNPDILERRSSPSRAAAGDGQPGRTTPPPPNASQPTAGRDDDAEAVEALLDAQLGQSSAEKDTESGADRIRPLQRPPQRSPTRSPSRRSRTRSPPRSPTRRLGGMFSEPAVQSPLRKLGSEGGSRLGSLLAEPPRRSPVKPVPRPLPPPDPQRSEDVLEPLVAERAQRALQLQHRSGLGFFRASRQEEEQQPSPEPELPPTPEHPDPELTTSPPGIHNSSMSSTPSKPPRPTRPTKRPKGPARGSRIHGSADVGKVQSSSPLKQPPLKPTAGPAATAGATEETSTFPAKKKKGIKTLADAGESEVNRGRAGRPPRRVSAAARGIPPEDPDAEKKRERDALLAEVAGLEADLDLAAAENARIREAAPLGKDAVPLPTNGRDIVSLLRRRALPTDEDDTPDATEDWLQAAVNPIALLPFGQPPGGADSVADQLALLGQKDDILDAPIVSHHPIAMTADEALPYLQAFTPLAFQSHIFVLPAEPSPSPGAPPPPLLQKHVITATSTIPAGLFAARIEMTVSSKSLRITDLQVPRIEPATAEAELRPLLDRISATKDRKNGDGGGSSALVRNVTVLMWAMGEWVRVAVRRARFWVALERQLLGKGGAGGFSAAANMQILQARRKRKRRQRRKPQQTTESGDDDEEDDGDGDGVNGDTHDHNKKHKQSISEAELLVHAGRTAIDIDLPLAGDNGHPTSRSAASGLRVQWAIRFDWTGEAQSQIGVLVGVPGKWRKADDRGRLAGLPALFDQLVRQDGDPAVAVQTVAALLAGDGESGI